MRLRILTTTYLGQTQYYRGEYERVVELATDNLAPADWVYESFGSAQRASVVGRIWLALSLAELGRFAEAAEYGAEAIRLVEPTRHAFDIGVAHRHAATLHLLKGDWAKARSVIEHGISVFRTANVGAALLPSAIASFAWVLAQLGEANEALNRIQESEQLVERQAMRGGIRLGRAYYSLGRACLLLGRLDEARRLSAHAVESSSRYPGDAAHAQHLLGDIATHPDRFDA